MIARYSRKCRKCASKMRGYMWRRKVQGKMRAGVTWYCAACARRKRRETSHPLLRPRGSRFTSVINHLDGSVSFNANKYYEKRPRWIRVDLEDLDAILSLGRWTTRPDAYATAGLMLHSFVLPGRNGGDVIDHINRDRTDNRKKNLRFITKAGNSQNRGSPDLRERPDYGSYR